ncbi:hypothetical protein EV667_1606 [Ancylobacter aquaticus]|uniref:Uncharacterized protein n=1 Tax=Ancylobacter aquaticus TaxID=100 RepID=A0A4V2PK92_ANCAQ|nr:hypothetical protein [Ancylobacter aquaticus]TCK31496.1 hypothetical protein EV667_1606 [Ancylobacter aquaticus]
MRTLLYRLLLGLTGATLFLLVWAFLWISGWVIVIDETDGVETAVITNSTGAEQKLFRLWRGLFYTIPKMEGTIEVRCYNGARLRQGYATGYLPSELKVVGESPCEKMISADCPYPFVLPAAAHCRDNGLMN